MEDMSEEDQAKMSAFAAMVEDALGVALAQMQRLGRLMGLPGGLVMGAFVMALCSSLAKAHAFTRKYDEKMRDMFIGGVNELIRQYIPIAEDKMKQVDKASNHKPGSSVEDQVNDALNEILKKRRQEPT